MLTKTRCAGSETEFVSPEEKAFNAEFLSKGYAIVPFSPAQRRAVAQAVRANHRPAVDGRAFGDPLSGWSSHFISTHG
ncbi:MAG: hypothetical protein O3A20_06195 [Planctomycetota bacterium]|nr:hypothetical protein [Planctomycetota bacterium]